MSIPDPMDNSINPYAAPASLIPHESSDPELMRLEQEAEFAHGLALWSIPGSLGLGMLGFGMAYVAHEAAQTAISRISGTSYAGTPVERRAEQAKLLAQVVMAVSACALAIVFLTATAFLFGPSW